MNKEDKIHKTMKFNRRIFFNNIEILYYFHNKKRLYKLLLKLKQKK